MGRPRNISANGNLYCSRCKEYKEPDQFYPINKGRGCSAYCRECQNTYNRGRARQRRSDTLDILGNACACCGEGRRQFLTVGFLDKAAEDRKRFSNRAPYTIQTYIRDNNFDRSLFAIRCYNCNIATEQFGFCHGDAPADWEP